MSMFHAVNPTDKYLVIVDNKRIECDTLEEANALYNKIGNIEDSPFGAACIMSPKQIDENIYGDVATELITDTTTEVNADYIEKHKARSYSAFLRRQKISTPAERLENRRIFEMYFGKI